MATDKKGVIVYADWIDKFEELNDEEAGRLIKHFFRYVNDLNPEAPDRITKISFIDIEKCLKRDLKKWETTLEGRSKAGIASAEARRLKKLAQQELTNSTSVKSVEENPTNPTVNDNVNDNVKDNVSKNKFTPEQFLIWFNDSRTKLLEKPSNSNLLSSHSKQHLEILTSSYEGKDFGKALHNLCNDKWANESNQIIPKHFLNPENFDKYLQIEQKPLLTKKQKINRGWAI
jgi:alpha-L-arabinofuranosidase